MMSDVIKSIQIIIVNNKVQQNLQKAKIHVKTNAQLT